MPGVEVCTIQGMDVNISCVAQSELCNEDCNGNPVVILTRPFLPGDPCDTNEVCPGTNVPVPGELAADMNNCNPVNLCTVQCASECIAKFGACPTTPNPDAGTDVEQDSDTGLTTPDADNSTDTGDNVEPDAVEGEDQGLVVPKEQKAPSCSTAPNSTPDDVKNTIWALLMAMGTIGATGLRKRK